MNSGRYKISARNGIRPVIFFKLVFPVVFFYIIRGTILTNMSKKKRKNLSVPFFSSKKICRIFDVFFAMVARRWGKFSQTKSVFVEF
jgi:hypothetical protein